MASVRGCLLSRELRRERVLPGGKLPGLELQVAQVGTPGRARVIPGQKVAAKARGTSYAEPVPASRLSGLHCPSTHAPRSQGKPRDRSVSLPGGRAFRVPRRPPRCLPRPWSPWARSRSPRNRSCAPPGGRPAVRPGGPSEASTCPLGRGPCRAGTSDPSSPQPSRGAAPTAPAAASHTSSCPAAPGLQPLGGEDPHRTQNPAWERPGAGQAGMLSPPRLRGVFLTFLRASTCCHYPTSLKSGLRRWECKELPGRSGEKGTRPGKGKGGMKDFKCRLRGILKEKNLKVIGSNESILLRTRGEKRL